MTALFLLAPFVILMTFSMWPRGNDKDAYSDEEIDRRAAEHRRIVDEVIADYLAEQKRAESRS